MPFPAEDIDENGFYWMKIPEKPVQVVKIKGESTPVGNSMSVLWIYMGIGMMYWDSLTVLPKGTKFDGPIKKPKWIK